MQVFYKNLIFKNFEIYSLLVNLLSYSINSEVQSPTYNYFYSHFSLFFYSSIMFPTFNQIIVPFINNFNSLPISIYSSSPKDSLNYFFLIIFLQNLVCLHVLLSQVSYLLYFYYYLQKKNY